MDHDPPCTCGHTTYSHQTVSLRDGEGRCYRCPCPRYEPVDSTPYEEYRDAVLDHR